MVDEMKTSINSYNVKESAMNYKKKKGFDPKLKEEMLYVTLSSLMDLTKKGGTLLELGAGTGIFSKMILEKEHFSEIIISDGAEAMLDIAKSELLTKNTRAKYEIIDFTSSSWSQKYIDNKFDAVTSSMALHHAKNKKKLFTEIYKVLKPGGTLVFCDHLSGATSVGDKLIGYKRARIKLGSKTIEEINLENYIDNENKEHIARGKHCESVENYFNYLKEARFKDVDCLWRNYWLAVFIAKKTKEVSF